MPMTAILQSAEPIPRPTPARTSASSLYLTTDASGERAVLRPGLKIKVWRGGDYRPPAAPASPRASYLAGRCFAIAAAAEANSCRPGIANQFRPPGTAQKAMRNAGDGALKANIAFGLSDVEISHRRRRAGSMTHDRSRCSFITVW